LNPLVAAYGASRIVLGATGLVAPRAVGRAFGIGDTPTAAVAARHIAVRDLIAGTGIVIGARRGTARGWLEAAALTDALDAAVAVVAGATGALSRRRAALVVGLAGGSAVTGWSLARQSSSAASADAS
jgi:hypothetical protein